MSFPPRVNPKSGNPVQGQPAYFFSSFLILTILVLIVSCRQTEGPISDSQTLSAHGRDLYMTYCIACHNPDPALEGALGPPIKGSDKILLEAKVIRNTYPEGHMPKRPTKAMVPMPFLAGDLDSLEAFLKK